MAHSLIVFDGIALVFDNIHKSKHQ
jgi:hypothetical protein